MGGQLKTISNPFPCLTTVMSLQSSDLKLAKQANLTFEALLAVLKFQMGHASDFGLPQSYADEVMHLMAEVARFALGSGMRHFHRACISASACLSLTCKIMNRICHICHAQHLQPPMVGRSI